MPIAVYRCTKCGREVERLEITTEDKAEAPPVCDGAGITPIEPGNSRSGVHPTHDPTPMERLCGSSSIAHVTLRGTWVRFSSNKPPVEHDRHPRSI